MSVKPSDIPAISKIIRKFIKQYIPNTAVKYCNTHCATAVNIQLPLCTLSHSRNTSSLPVHEPPTLSMRHIFSRAAHGASAEHAKQYQ